MPLYFSIKVTWTLTSVSCNDYRLHGLLHHIVGIRLSCQIMESVMGLVLDFVWSSVWRGWQVQSSSGSVCHRWRSGRWRVGWSPGILDAPSCIVSCPPAACFACPHQSSPLFEQHSAMHCGRLLSPPSCLRQCLLKFKIALADILKTQFRAACTTVSCCQLPIQHIFWDAAIAHAMHVAKPAQPALTEEEMYAVRASTPQHSSIGDLVLPSNA